MGQKRNYSDLDVFLKDLKSDIKDTLSKEVFDEVRDIELEHVQRDVFDSYRPKIYNRRSSGGIDDPRNIVGQVDDMTLYVDNVTPYNPGYGTYNSGTTLADLINEGEGGKHKLYYDFTGNFIQPRPFLDNTQNEVDKSNRVENALKKGLQRRGYTVKKG